MLLIHLLVMAYMLLVELKVLIVDNLVVMLLVLATHLHLLVV